MNELKLFNVASEEETVTSDFTYDVLDEAIANLELSMEADTVAAAIDGNIEEAAINGVETLSAVLLQLEEGAALDAGQQLAVNHVAVTIGYPTAITDEAGVCHAIEAITDVIDLEVSEEISGKLKAAAKVVKSAPGKAKGAPGAAKNSLSKAASAPVGWADRLRKSATSSNLNARIKGTKNGRLGKDTMIRTKLEKSTVKLNGWAKAYPRVFSAATYGIILLSLSGAVVGVMALLGKFKLNLASLENDVLTKVAKASDEKKAAVDSILAGDDLEYADGKTTYSGEHFNFSVDDTSFKSFTGDATTKSELDEAYSAGLDKLNSVLSTLESNTSEMAKVSRAIESIKEGEEGKVDIADFKTVEGSEEVSDSVMSAKGLLESGYNADTITTHERDISGMSDVLDSLTNEVVKATDAVTKATSKTDDASRSAVKDISDAVVAAGHTPANIAALTQEGRNAISAVGSCVSAMAKTYQKSLNSIKKGL